MIDLVFNASVQPIAFPGNKQDDSRKRKKYAGPKSFPIFCPRYFCLPFEKSDDHDAGALKTL
jgi:hypothetical protein